MTLTADEENTVAVPDVQMNVNDLLAAFAAENATAVQRAVVAEQKVKAYMAALEQAHEVIELMRTPDAEPEDGDAATDPAVTAIDKTPRRRRTPPA